MDSILLSAAGLAAIFAYFRYTTEIIRQVVLLCMWAAMALAALYPITVLLLRTVWP